ncbi:DUF3644 domain-containing protein [Mycobacterium sp. NPDC050441]|uniref:DUF3644 domain-containing protein n=1 Tax=Mycobacterium sp. NPDC050441 TaxID=3155403 RepID=UPI0033FC7259
MARPQRWELLLRASQQEALLAVSLFNDPGRERALEGFIVHMHIAWTCGRPGRQIAPSDSDCTKRYS